MDRYRLIFRTRVCGVEPCINLVCRCCHAVTLSLLWGIAQILEEIVSDTLESLQLCTDVTQLLYLTA